MREIEKLPARSLLLAGDWNEPPDSGGRYSPVWIAQQAGLRIYAPIRGKHGRIDFYMTNAEIPEGVKRRPGGGSDHGLIWADVLDPNSDERLRVACWNVERDRGQRERAEMLRFLNETADELAVDVFALQEVADYRKILAVPGFVTIQFVNPHGAWHNALLVRKTHDIDNARARQMSRLGWFISTGAPHSPTVTTLARIDDWLLVGSVHEPPTVDWKGGRIIGPARRVAARVTAARSYIRVAKRVRSWNARHAAATRKR